MSATIRKCIENYRHRAETRRSLAKSCEADAAKYPKHRIALLQEAEDFRDNADDDEWRADELEARLAHQTSVAA